MVDEARYRARDVFTPGAFPRHTYIERTDTKLERELRSGSETKGYIVSVSGPSKCGKSVLAERVFGDDLIAISGAGIDRPDMLWSRVLDAIGSPSETTQSRTDTNSASTGVATGAQATPGGVGFSATASAGGTRSAAAGASSKFARTGLLQVVKELGDSDFVVLVDDFHYISRGIQGAVANEMKEAARQGVRLVTAAVPHRADDMVRANPDLKGRVMSLDIDYWTPTDLAKIGARGFRLLGLEFDLPSLKRLAREAAGSPQLMQALCLCACDVVDVRVTELERRKVSLNDDMFEEIFTRTAALNDYRSLVQVLDAGPKVRGRPRKTFTYQDGSSGDAYTTILRALALDPPSLTFPYEDILKRTTKSCVGESPEGSSVVNSCRHMSKSAQTKFPQDRVIEWDDEKLVLDIPEPHFLFYLRWSKRSAKAG